MMPPSLPPYRCWVPDPSLSPGTVDLSSEEARHLGQVRRAGPGTAVAVLNGRGRIGIGEVSQLDRRHARVSIREVRDTSPPDPHVTLAIGALKQSAWEDVLRHAVELGVNRILRVQTSHAVADLDAARAESKLDRWRELMIQAVKQSANPWLPELDVADSLETALALTAGSDLHLAALLVDPAASLPILNRVKTVVLWIGPEGDFSPDEVTRLRDAGCRPVTLGPRILRAETAALALTSAVRIPRA